MLLSMQAELTAHQQVTIEVNIASRDAVEKVLLQLAKEKKIIAFDEVTNDDIESLFIHLHILNVTLAEIFSMDSKKFARKRLARGIGLNNPPMFFRYVCVEELVDNLTIHSAKTEAKRLITKALHDVKRERTDSRDMARFLAVVGVRNNLEDYHDRLSDKEMRYIMMEIEFYLEVALRMLELNDTDEYKHELLKCASNRRTWDDPDWFGYNISN